MPGKAYAQRVGLCLRSLANLRRQGMPVLVVSARKVLYPVTEADEWLRERFMVQRRRTRERFADRINGGAA